MAQSITDTAEKEGIMYVSGSAATSFLPYVGQAKYLKLLKVEKSKNKTNGIRSAISQKTTESLQRIDGSKKENSLWPNGIKNSGKQYVQEVTHFFRQNFMPNPSFQLSTANQAPINVWSRATIENRMDSIVPASLRKVEGKGTTKGTGNTSKAFDDVVKDGSHFLDEFKLKPNVKYETNGYLYQTDELGRIERASGELTLEMGERNSKHQLAAGGEDRVKAPSTQGDHGGHLIGTQFNGSPLIDNIVAMNGNVNVSAYKKLEFAWAKALRDKREVIVDIRPVYEGDSVRPVSFNIKYRIDGEKFKASLKNVYGGK